ncbi:J domain-containing protein [Citrus sinensis]|uniref:J domain-containing protein n=1 Tax=Citrus sinensis TaxID=2711 RepID=A0ACB8KM18_CITSI|nr:J domain-containing protein [Citrus sinensis]
MDGGGGSNGGSLSYYAILGIRKDASFSDIRSAYHKLAMVTILTSFHKSTTFFFSRQKFSDRLKLFFLVIMKKWHPDRSAKNPGVAGEAKCRFQQIQEAYSVLSDENKRSMYDAGLYDPLEEEDEDFYGFVQEMVSMMNNVKDEGDSFEDLQRMFVEMVDGMSFDFNYDPTDAQRACVNTSKGKAAKRGTSRC